MRIQPLAYFLRCSVVQPTSSFRFHVLPNTFGQPLVVAFTPLNLSGSTNPGTATVLSSHPLPATA